MTRGIVRSWRLLLAVVAVLCAVAVSVPTAALADWKFDVTGTVHSKNESKETIILITDDLGVKGQPITIDMSDMSSQFVALAVGQPVTMTIMSRESDAYLALSLVSQGSYVHRTDLGTREEFQTRDSSIKAHVGNVPEDDESLSQQHRNNDLSRNDDDD